MLTFHKPRRFRSHRLKPTRGSSVRLTDPSEGVKQTPVEALWVEAGRACFTFLVSLGALAGTILLALWCVAAMQGADPLRVLP